MKDAPCKNCEEGKINSTHNKSGLCKKCANKKYHEDNREEIKRKFSFQENFCKLHIMFNKKTREVKNES